MIINFVCRTQRMAFTQRIDGSVTRTSQCNTSADGAPGGPSDAMTNSATGGTLDAITDSVSGCVSVAGTDSASGGVLCGVSDVADIDSVCTILYSNRIIGPI